MKIVLFCHSLVSDWNHGNAHFLRGIASELLARGHQVVAYEPADSWSRQNLFQQYGSRALEDFRRVYPGLNSIICDETLDLGLALDGADVVLVHEWNAPELVSRVGRHHAAQRSQVLLFHDTHHRAATTPAEMEVLDLSDYDGALVYGEAIRQIYLQRRWAERVWVWHEAADTRVFRPRPGFARSRDLVWIGNWGDEERTAELHEFLIDPAHALALDTQVFGVRYPPSALQDLQRASIDYGGWLPNFRVPEIFAQFRVTVHIPRAPYVRRLPGIPTIRPFEALACGIPLISAPWRDSENLFTPGKDFLVARNGVEMQKHLRAVLSDEEMARIVAEHGRRTVLSRHTCAHRVDELLAIVRELKHSQMETPSLIR